MNFSVNSQVHNSKIQGLFSPPASSLFGWWQTLICPRRRAVSWDEMFIFQTDISNPKYPDPSKVWLKSGVILKTL